MLEELFPGLVTKDTLYPNYLHFTDVETIHDAIERLNIVYNSCGENGCIMSFHYSHMTKTLEVVSMQNFVDAWEREQTDTEGVPL